MSNPQVTLLDVQMPTPILKLTLDEASNLELLRVCEYQSELHILLVFYKKDSDIMKYIDTWDRITKRISLGENPGFIIKATKTGEREWGLGYG